MMLSVLTVFILMAHMIASTTDNCTTYRLGVIVDETRDSLFFRDQMTSWTDTVLNNTNVDLIWLNASRTKVMFKADLAGVISSQNQKQTLVTSTGLTQQKFPHISLISQDVPKNGRYETDETIYLGLSIRLHSQLIQDLIRETHWASITLVLGQSTGHDLRNRLLFDLAAANVLIHPIVIHTHKEEELLRTLLNTPLNIVIMANYSEVMAFVRACSLRKSLEHTFLLLISDDFELKEMPRLTKSCERCHIFFVEYEKSDYPDSVIFPDCIEDGPITEGHTGLQLLFIEAIRLLILASNVSTSEEQTPNDCRLVNSPEAVSQTLRCLVRQRTPSYKISSLKNFPTFSIDLIGRWTTSKRFEGNESGKILDSYHNLGGRTLRIAVVPMNLVFLGQRSDGTIDGLVIDMLNEIAEQLNFKYEFVEPADRLFGAPTGNGSWTGMIGMVMNGDADIAAGPFTLTHQRAEVIDFTTPFTQQSVGILTPVPGNSLNLFQFYKPFCTKVWILITVFAISTWLCLCTIAFVLHHQQKTADMRNRLEYLMLVISSLSEQGPAFHPPSTSARCLLGVWLVFTVLVVAMYTAHLAAVYTVTAPTVPINSLQDVVNDDDMTILVQYGTSTWTAFEDSHSQIYQTVNERKVPVNTMSEAADLVALGKHVFIGGRSPLLFQVAYGCGKVRLADERLFSGSYGLVLPKHSPYKGAFDRIILSLVQSGVMSKWENKWLHPHGNCSDGVKENSINKLPLETVGGVFIAYGFIVAIAFFVLPIERIYTTASR